MMRIIFVCSGNICRSPMAAGLARQGLKEANLEAVIISAGTLNINGQPASPNAVKACELVDIDISDHRSQGVSGPLMAMADHIVVMAPRHEDALLDLDPSLESKIDQMWTYGKHPTQLEKIADPVGQDLEAFVTCRTLLETCIADWIEQLS